MTPTSLRSLPLHAWVAVVLFAVAVLGWGLTPLSTYDLWWHLATGAKMIDTASLLPTDPFSFTHGGAPWPYKDAGAAVLLYAVHAIGGPAALVVLKALVFAATAALVAATCRERGAPGALTATVTAGVLAASAFRFTERPAIFSFVLTAAAVWMVERHDRGRGALWPVIPATLVAANLHRGALLIPVLVASYVAARALERHRLEGSAAAVAAGCAAAAVCTPFGLAALAPSWAMLAGDTLRGAIPEWQPLSLGGVVQASPASLGLAAALCLGLGASAAQRRSIRWWDGALALSALAVGALGLRFLAYFALLSAPVLATHLGASRRPWRGRPGALIAVAAPLALLASVAGIEPLGAHLGRGLEAPILGGRYPERAVEQVRAWAAEGLLHGRMLNEFGLGGYLIAELGPQFPVYVDGRNDLVYGQDFMERYGRVLVEPAVLAEEVERWGIEWLFLHNRPYDTARRHLDRSGRWALVFACGEALIYVRRGGPNAELAERHGYRILAGHDPVASVTAAWARPELREDALAEARRMAAEDPASVPANVGLATALSLAGRGAELDAVIDTLVALGWRPPRSASPLPPPR